MIRPEDLRSTFYVVRGLAADERITREWFETEIGKLALDADERAGLLDFFDSHRRRAVAERFETEPGAEEAER